MDESEIREQARHDDQMAVRRERDRYREALQEILSKKSLAAPSLWRIAEDALAAASGGGCSKHGGFVGMRCPQCFPAGHGGTPE